MELKAFEILKNKFSKADTNTKIDIYTSTEGLTQTQYRELLYLFPLNELNKLEEALA